MNTKKIFAGLLVLCNVSVFSMKNDSNQKCVYQTMLDGTPMITCDRGNYDEIYVGPMIYEYWKHSGIKRGKICPSGTDQALWLGQQINEELDYISVSGKEMSNSRRSEGRDTARRVFGKKT